MVVAVRHISTGDTCVSCMKHANTGLGTFLFVLPPALSANTSFIVTSVCLPAWWEQFYQADLQPIGDGIRLVLGSAF